MNNSNRTTWALVFLGGLALAALGCSSSPAVEADTGGSFEGGGPSGDAGPSRRADATPAADLGPRADGAAGQDDAEVVVGADGAISAAAWGDKVGDGSWTGPSGGVFGYKRVSGPLFEIQARVLTGDVDPACRVGLMIRGALEDDGPHGAIALTPELEAELSWRPRAATSDASRRTGPLAKPYWLRLKRVRNHLRAFYSPDGRNWLMHGYGPEVGLPESIHIGLWASGGSNGGCDASFDQVSITTPTVASLDKEIAPLPPMGWNSWNHVGPELNARIVTEMIDTFVSRGLRDAGYTFVNLDDYWQKHPNRGRGQRPLTFNESRFPDGIAALADHAHSVGLKLGIYSGPGDKTCAGFPGSAGHVAEDVRTWASWGIDYLKYDDCCLFDRTREESIGYFDEMRTALAAGGREIVHSVTNCGAFEDWQWAGQYGHLWRTNMDVYNSWLLNGDHDDCGSWGEWSVLTIIDNALPLWQHHGFGNYNDLDMLVYALGEGASDVDVNIKSCAGGMNRTEFRSHFTLWAILGAPLLHGSDLRAVPQWAIDVITNPEVIALDQDPLTLQGQLVREANGVQVIAKALADGSRGVALLNRGSKPRSIALRWRDIGLPAGAATVRDLWGQTDLGSFDDTYQVVGIGAHETAALRVAETAPAAGIALEAEAAALQGGIVAKRCMTCYGGGFAEGTGSITFAHVYAAAATDATVTFYYLDAGTPQSLELRVNGAAAQAVTLPAAGGDRRMARYALTVQLKGGDNTLRLTAGTTALTLDRIVVDSE